MPNIRGTGGVDGTTGNYAPDPDVDQAIEAVQADPRLQGRAAQNQAGVLALPFDAKPLEPDSAGWALVVPRTEAAELEDALRPLIDRRRAMAGERFKVLPYDGESREDWLAGRGVADTDIEPAKVPYYLMLAGQTTNLSFSFVHDLALDYAVGRVELDSHADYRAWAERIVAYEEAETPPKMARRVDFFGPRHDFDEATQISADHLLGPLSDVENPERAIHKTHFDAGRVIGQTATKAGLSEVLRRSNGRRPAVLFTASHGVFFPRGHAHQRARMGALLCQDWPDVSVMNDSFYFTAADLDGANVEGMIAFHFACYAAGTPEEDRFAHTTDAPAARLADAPFIAALPKELLRRGARAVVGHVDRAWGFSFLSSAGDKRLQAFDNFLGHVASGHPVGHAMRSFAHRYARYSVDLTNALSKPFSGLSKEELQDLWTQRNDAGSYLIVGDPMSALRLDALEAREAP